jgi:hypothetical protein
MTTEFIEKYSQLCDKYHHLYIHIGKLKYDNVFTTNISQKDINNYIKTFEKMNLPIIKNTKGHISIYYNEYHYNNNDEFSIVEYNNIDTHITNNLLFQFSSVKYNNNTGSYNNPPNDEYDYESITIQLAEGCNIEILKKNIAYNHYYTMFMVIYKPCNINKYLTLFN